MPSQFIQHPHAPATPALSLSLFYLGSSTQDVSEHQSVPSTPTIKRMADELCNANNNNEDDSYLSPMFLVIPTQPNATRGKQLSNKACLHSTVNKVWLTS
ncbi:hypothetical protein [Sporisorium scitamineum]|uniref:Uncharacterized protein n=1 Tax=Sporisorium scitamineum TaxID=49012 RepID=A0A0F7S7T9_9BASI|nr:hypothetical protein [Sporisorium scitamineum]